MYGTKQTRCNSLQLYSYTCAMHCPGHPRASGVFPQYDIPPATHKGKWLRAVAWLRPLVGLWAVAAMIVIGICWGSNHAWLGTLYCFPVTWIDMVVHADRHPRISRYITTRAGALTVLPHVELQTTSA